MWDRGWLASISSIVSDSLRMVSCNSFSSLLRWASRASFSVVVAIFWGAFEMGDLLPPFLAPTPPPHYYSLSCIESYDHNQCCSTTHHLWLAGCSASHSSSLRRLITQSELQAIIVDSLPSLSIWHPSLLARRLGSAS